MSVPLSEKSTLEEISTRFDRDVERFSNLETGQQAVMDAPLILDLMSQTAAAILKQPQNLLDLGCGAGNLTLKILQRQPHLDCTLVDLSRPMLDRAKERVSQATKGRVETIQSDMRKLSFAPESFDVILAGAVLHHLRDDQDWTDFFRFLHQWLKNGGILLVGDMLWFDHPEVQNMMWKRYGNYLESLKGEEYRQTVFDYIDKEDSPRSLPFQFDLLKKSGFREFDLLHRNTVFAAYYAQK